MAWAWFRTHGATEKPISRSGFMQAEGGLPTDAAKLPRRVCLRSLYRRGPERQAPRATNVPIVTCLLRQQAAAQPYFQEPPATYECASESTWSQLTPSAAWKALRTCAGEKSVPGGTRCCLNRLPSRMIAALPPWLATITWTMATASSAATRACVPDSPQSLSCERQIVALAKPGYAAWTCSSGRM